MVKPHEPLAINVTAKRGEKVVKVHLENKLSETIYLCSVSIYKLLQKPITKHIFFVTIEKSMEHLGSIQFVPYEIIPIGGSIDVVIETRKPIEIGKYRIEIELRVATTTTSGGVASARWIALYSSSSSKREVVVKDFEVK